MLRAETGDEDQLEGFCSSPGEKWLSQCDSFDNENDSEAFIVLAGISKLYSDS